MGGAEAYRGYDAWKSWDWSRFPRLTDPERAYFSGELAGIPLTGADVLEIGFGAGGFLAFAREAGARVAGTELLPQAVEAARAAGIEVFDIDLERSLPAAAGRFDLIAAFDVFEHLTFADLDAMLSAFGRLLKPGGRVVARFPNGESPIGRAIQHGDASHRIALTRGLLEQMLVGHPFAVERAGNPFRVPHGDTAPARAMVRFRHRLQDVVERTANWIFETDYRFAVNLVVVLRRR